MADGFTCICLGIVFASGLFLITARRIARVIFGVLLLSHATNLYLLLMEHRVAGGKPPFLGHGAANHVDPLPQALILTAIVIGFAVAGFVLALGKRMRELDEEAVPPEPADEDIETEDEDR